MDARRMAAPVGVGLAAAAAVAAAADLPLPDPGERGSHERYVEALRSEEARLAAELLGRYEQRIGEAPDDVVAAVERCRFLAAAFYDPELEENPREAERAACVEEVEARFSEHPDVRVYAVEQRWGEEAAEAGDRFLSAPPAGTQPHHLVAIHTHVARQLQYDDSERAVRHAEAAMALDPSVDLRILVGEAKIDAGDRAGARSVLALRLEETGNAWELEAKGALLADLEDFEAALRAFREVERRGEETARKLDHARALAGVGRIGDARAMYEQGEPDWATLEARRAHFEFELEHGTAESARAAYDALVAQGFDADMLGRGRLELLAAHPGAPWKWGDASGLFVLAAITVALAMLPAAFILPIYACGRVRRRRLRPVDAPAPERFGLGHAWVASAAMILAMCAGFLVYPEVLDGDGYPIGSATADYFLTSAVASLVGALLVVRRRGAELVAPGRWRWRRMLGIGVLVAATFHLTAVGVAFAIGREAGDADTAEMMQSLRTSYGVPMTFLIAALLVPIVEEVVFRGVLLSAFRKHLSPGWANLAQASMFGLVHVHPVVTPAAFALGLASGRATRVSGSLRTALLAHVLVNAIACGVLVSSGTQPA
jgi:hypothetical protein